MSKKALRKDLRMEIKRNKSRFISILLIVALGVAFFSGLRSSESDMRFTADAFTDEHNLMDLRVISTMGLTDDDVSALGELENVQVVEAGNFMYAMTNKNDTDYVLEVVAKPDSMNTVSLTEGEMPNDTDECLADNRLKKSGFELGDVIELKSGTKDEISNSLSEDTYRIVGFADLPLYIGIERGSATIGSGQVSGFIVVQPQVFTQDYYTQICLTAKGAMEETAFTDEYRSAVEALRAQVEAEAKERCQARYDEIRADARVELDDAQAEYDKNEAETREKLETAKKELEEGKTKLEKAKKELEAAEDELKTNRETLEAQIAQLNAALALQDSEELRAQLAAAEQGLEQIEQGETKLSKNRAELEENEKSLKENEQAYESSKDKADKELADAKEKLDEGWDEWNDISMPKWTIYDREDLPGYYDYGSNAERIGAIGRVFPAIFFLVAALVALTAITRMVEEQRTQIGTYKALGYGKGSVMFRYLAYALLATLSGGVIGVLVGEKVFPYVIIVCYRIIYTPFLKIVIPYNLTYALISVLIAAASTSLAAIAACHHALSAQPAVLMRPVAPKAGRRVWLEHLPFIWNHLSFSQKAALRNLFRYKKRLVMTVFGIGCCCGLMVVGFGLKDSIMNIASIQYDNIQLYDAMVSVDDSHNEKELAQRLSDNEQVEESAPLQMKSMDASENGVIRTAYVIVAEDHAALESMMVFRSSSSGEKYELDDDGVIVSEQLAGALGISAGDNFTLKSGEDTVKTVRVSHVAENYLMHYIYMTKNYYTEIFGEEPQTNMYWLKLTDTGLKTQEELGKELIELDGVLTVSYVSTTRETIESMLNSLYLIVIVLVISASLLAFVVIYNLNNINISERHRELATIKLLGFYDLETAAYIYRENVYLTIAGALVGLGIGKLLHSFVINTIEVNQVMFGRTVTVQSYICCVLLTILFSAFVNAVMYFQIKKIDMVESLKSVE